MREGSDSEEVGARRERGVRVGRERGVSEWGVD